MHAQVLAGIMAKQKVEIKWAELIKVQCLLSASFGYPC